MSGGGVEREGHTESKALSRLELRAGEIMAWAEVGRLIYWAAQAPLELRFLHVDP